MLNERSSWWTEGSYARQQWRRAQVQEMQAKAVAVEAEVPLAMGEALKSSNLGVLPPHNYADFTTRT